jgi:peptidoglycan/xylan/chitin deacetylase (PgdA/CDA1 family)
MRCFALALLAAVALCLTGVSTTAAAGEELLYNPGAEVADGTGTAPIFWTDGSWGVTHTATWSTDAHTGARSVRVDVSARVDGDAKWMPATVPVTGGSYYTYSDWYKSDAGSAVSVYYERADGTGQWSNLFAGIPPSSGWSEYRTGFTMPADAVRATFAHFIARIGFLAVDDVSMREVAAPPGFSRPMVSLTFDDGSRAFHETALPMLDQKGFKTTQYIPTAGLMSNPPDPWMMTADQIRQMAVGGHEIGSHSVTHPHMMESTPAALTSELQGSRAVLESIAQRRVVSFAYPYGEYDAGVIAATRAAGYTSGRSVEPGFVSRLDAEDFDIRVQNITSTTTIEEFRSWVDYAKAHNYWLTLVYHEVVPDGSAVGPYDTTVSRFQAQLDYLQASGMGSAVMPVATAFAIVQSELGPVAGTVELVREGATAVRAVATGFVDPDPGDTVTLHYEWLLDGQVLAGTTGPLVDFAVLGRDPRGHKLTVRVHATDGDGHTSPVVETSADVANSVPGAGTVTIDPAAPRLGDRLTTRLTGFDDPDGDQPTWAYRWYRNGALLTSADGSLSTIGFAPGDTVRVDVQADDGHGGLSPLASAEVRLAGDGPVPAPTAAPNPDRKGPVISIASPKARRYTVGRRITLRFSGKDPAGVKRLTATLRRPRGAARKVRAGARIRLAKRGRYVLRVTATDRLGNVATRQVVFRVVS